MGGKWLKNENIGFEKSLIVSRGKRVACIFTASFTLFSVILGCSGQYTNCYAFGTEHVLTFDNARIDFSSPCKFELAYTCTPTVIVPALFRVNIQNVMVDQVSMVDCAEVLYEDFTVTLCRDQTATVSMRRTGA